MLTIDTSSWIEYFSGSIRGLKVKELIDSKEKIITPIIVLYEFSCKAAIEGIDIKSQLDFVKQRSAILNLNENLVESTGKIYAKIRKQNNKISLPDAIIIAIAEQSNSRIVSCDIDFKDIKDAIIIK